MFAWSPIAYEGPEQSLSAIWISPTHRMPLDCEWHRVMVGHRIDRLVAQLDEPEEAVAEMVATLYAEGCWPDTKIVPVKDAGRMLIASNGNVSECFATWGISEALPVARVFDMPSVRERLEDEISDPWEALVGWIHKLVGWPYKTGPSAQEEAIQSVHLKLCAHPHHR
jgi:hypothetical protein